MRVDFQPASPAQYSPLPLPSLSNIAAISGFMRSSTDLTFRGLDQPIDVAHQRRLAGPGESHDAEDLAFRDADGYVANADDGFEPVQDFRLGQVFAPARLHGLVGAFAENLPYVAGDDDLA